MVKAIRATILALLILLISGVSSTGQESTGPDIFSFGNRGISSIRNVILFIGDGMSYQNEIALSRYLNGTDSGLAWQDFPYRGYMTTWDIDTYNRYASASGADLYSPDRFEPSLGYDSSRGGAEPYGIGEIPDTDYFFTSLPEAGAGADTLAFPATDSAAAATAMATGQKTDEGNIAWASGDPEGGELVSITQKYREQYGSAIGFVTTVEFSHATPSPFFAHHVYRGWPGVIAHEMITETKPEVVIGGGHPDWETDYISYSDLNLLRNSDEYVLVERTSGVDGGESLLQASERAVTENKKLFGLYGGSSGYFDRAEAHDDPGNPGFDRNSENPTLAQGVEAALDVLSADPDGFFLVVEQGDIDWANHYRNYHWMIGAMYDLEMAVREAVEFIDRPGDNISWTNTLVVVTADHVTGSLRLNDEVVSGRGDLPTMVGSRYHYTFPDGEARYITTVHTNEPVMLYANGPYRAMQLFQGYEGAWYPGTRLIDNTQLFDVMEDFGRLPF